LESLGVLAGGIAHDFNNLLGGVFGNIDLALDSLDDRTEITKFLNRSISAIERAKDLTQQLLTFSKGGIPKKRTIELAPLLKESRDLSLSGSAIECKMKIEDRLHPVNADANQMSQVFNNVLINARQAMPNGGEVTINANNQTLTDNEIASLPGGEYVKIDIQDHGEGIPPSSMSKIFDPFFTTKETGSGLGLATCYSIIKKHDGLILVDSTLGKGTHVNIYLPSSKLATTSLSIHAPTPTKRGKGRILLMDDEELILEVAEAMLQRL
jgi:two-component system, cell cycle sensor histidine kinase and response regulator CckA